MKITDREAREKIVRARTNLLVSNGFFGFLAMHLKLVEANEHNGLISQIDTMAVDGFSLFYNPKFVHELSEQECEGVVAHEVMHCCFQHFSRRQNRHPMTWNIAGDFVINLDLIEAGFVLPGKPMGMDMLGNPAAKGIKGHLLDHKLKGMNTETVYDMLPIKYINIKVGGGGKDDGSGEEMQDPGGCGGVMDSPNEAKKAEAEQNWETTVRIAVQVAQANNAGQIPGSLKKLIENLTRPKVSWRDKTRRFIDQSMVKDVSWSRIGRRSVSIGALLPGMISDRLHHLIFAVDISGSISFELCREMVSEVGGALDEGTADMITVLYADTQVQHVDTFCQGDIVTAGEYRGGGTDFRDTFNWIKNNAPDASCVIYLTDLQVYEHGEDPGCPVMWATYCPTTEMYEQLADKVPFGMAMHISNTMG